MSQCARCHQPVPIPVEGTRLCMTCDAGSIPEHVYEEIWRAGYKAGIATGRKSMHRPVVCCDIAAAS